MTTYELKGLFDQPYVKALPDLERVLGKLAYEPQSESDRRYIIDVMCIVFGVDGNRGWLIQCAEDINKNEGVDSQSRFDRLISLMAPEGPFWRILENFKNVKCMLKVLARSYLRSISCRCTYRKNSLRCSNKSALAALRQRASLRYRGNTTTSSSPQSSSSKVINATRPSWSGSCFSWWFH